MIILPSSNYYVFNENMKALHVMLIKMNMYYPQESFFQDIELLQKHGIVSKMQAVLHNVVM